MGYGASDRQFVETGTRKQIIVAMLTVIDLTMLISATLRATYFQFHSLAAAAGFEHVSASVTHYGVSPRHPWRSRHESIQSSSRLRRSITMWCLG